MYTNHFNKQKCISNLNIQSYLTASSSNLGLGPAHNPYLPARQLVILPYPVHRIHIDIPIPIYILVLLVIHRGTNPLSVVSRELIWAHWPGSRGWIPWVAANHELLINLIAGIPETLCRRHILYWLCGIPLVLISVYWLLDEFWAVVAEVLAVAVLARRGELGSAEDVSVYGVALIDGNQLTSLRISAILSGAVFVQVHFLAESAWSCDLFCADCGARVAAVESDLFLTILDSFSTVYCVMIGHFAAGTVLGDLTAEPTVLREMTVLLTDGACNASAALNNDIAITISFATFFASAFAHSFGCKENRLC